MGQDSIVCQTRSISESIIISQSQSEFVRDRKAAGDRIIKSNGQFWWETYPGFYQVMPWLTRCKATQAVRPALICWAYRAPLVEDNAMAANGTLPINLLQDIPSYDLEHLVSTRRYDLRKSRNFVTVVELTGPALLKAEGYEVLRSSWKRTGYGSLPKKDAYQATIAYTYTTKSLILAGLIKGRLGGYLEGYAVGSTAYILKIVLATEYLSTQIGTALVFDFVQICRRSGNIREVVYGQHSREDVNLVAFKERMGFPVVHIPTIAHINPLIGKMLHKYKPHVYYRLTGRG